MLFLGSRDFRLTIDDFGFWILDFGLFPIKLVLNEQQGASLHFISSGQVAAVHFVSSQQVATSDFFGFASEIFLAMTRFYRALA